MFLVPFVITNHPTFFFSPKTLFDPPYQGSEKTDPYIIWRKMKIILDGYLIAYMKRFDALIKTQKTSALWDVPFLKKKNEILLNMTIRHRYQIQDQEEQI